MTGLGNLFLTVVLCLNQLLGVVVRGQPWPHVPVAVNGQGYIYDATSVSDTSGNLIGRPGQTLAYDIENRLTQVSGAVSATYIYRCYCLSSGGARPT